MINSLLHETIVRDIVDTISDANDAMSDLKDNVSRVPAYRHMSSIAKASSDLVLVFPFMCDNTVSLETASMTAKAIERQCVTMLRLLFSSCQISSEADNGIDFIKQFHTNIKGKLDLDDFMGYMSSMAESGVIEITDPKIYNAVQEEVKHMYDTLPDAINESSLTDSVVLERYGDIEVLSEKSKFDNTSKGMYSFMSSAARTLDRKSKEVDKKLKDLDDKYGSGTMQDSEKLAQFYKNMMDSEKNRMIDSDVKKANELVPTMMTVNFISTNKDKTKSIPATFVCGVKCRLIPVDPMDIADRILVKHSDRNVLLSFIRATTKETSFIRDFLFAIDKAKIDAISQSKRGSSNKMWKVLERRAIKSRFNRAFSKGNDASMITTLGVSTETAEYIKKTNGIDIYDPRTARVIMEGYNLMGFVIIDEAGEADKFLWDTGEGYFETISFNNLEREASGGEYKKALNLMQKMYR